MAKVNYNRTVHPNINIYESASNVSTLSLLAYHHSQSFIHANNESWDYAYSSELKSAFSQFQETFDR